MCGGNYPFRKQLSRVEGETLVARTIRLLKLNGVKNIYISTDHNDFKKLKTRIIKTETSEQKWIDGAFPVLDEEVCYLFGDVLFSYDAIKTIVQAETDDIAFFASAPPFRFDYYKQHAEPFAFKVVNYQRFAESIEKVKQLYDAHKLRRCIAWELWQVIRQTQLNHIIVDYTVINDYTCDIDSEEQLHEIQKRIDDCKMRVDV